VRWMKTLRLLSSRQLRPLSPLRQLTSRPAGTKPQNHDWGPASMSSGLTRPDPDEDMGNSQPKIRHKPILEDAKLFGVEDTECDGGISYTVIVNPDDDHLGPTRPPRRAAPTR